MNKRYSQKEMKRVLKQDIEISAQTEEKIQEAYDCIRRGASVRSVRKTTRRGFGRYVAVAAVVGLLGISSVTALAINGYFEKTMQQKEDYVSYKFEVNYELTSYEVNIEPGYIPEGYTEVENAPGKYDKEGYRLNGISLAVINAAYLDPSGNSLDVDEVKCLEETVINGMEAHVITINYDSERITRIFDKRIYLFNPEDGYVGVVFGGNDISVEELKKVAENLTFTVTDTELDPILPQEREEQRQEAEAHMNEERLIKEYGVPQEYIYQIGDTVELSEYPGVNLTVNSVEVLDSIEGLDTGCFSDYDSRIAPYLTAEKTLAPYQRITFREKENGETEEVSREEMTQKFVKVSMKAENLKGETIDFWAGAPRIMSLDSVEEGNYKYTDIHSEPLNWQEYTVEADKGYPLYFDRTPYAGQMNSHFFFIDLEAGETLEYNLIYAVDEDELDNMYLQLLNRGMDWENQIFYDRYVDIAS